MPASPGCCGARMESRKPAPKDHYAVLGVDPESTSTEIRKAYRALAHRYHPDRAVAGEETTTNASERMVEINQAFAVLSDVKRRAKLDRELAPEKNPPTAATQQAVEDWELPVAPAKDAPVRGPRRSSAVDQSVAQEFVGKVKAQLLSESSGLKLREENVPGWRWFLQGKSWGASYSIGIRQLPALNANVARECVGELQSLVGKLRSSWKTNYFIFLLAFQSLSERDTVLKQLRAFCSRQETSSSKNWVNVIVLDLRQHQSVLCGKRTGDGQHNAILRALGVSG